MSGQRQTVKSAVERILDAINAHRKTIYDDGMEEFEMKNNKDFIDKDDSVRIKSLKNMYGTPYTESDILDHSKMMKGAVVLKSGVVVFRDGKKYTVHKEGSGFIVV